MLQQKSGLVISLLAIGLAVDRLSKLFSWHFGLTSQDHFKIIPVINTGWFWGWVANEKIFFWSAAVLLFAVMVIWSTELISKRRTVLILAWGLVLVGGVSNWWDRWWYGGVIDFINLLGVVRFNLADVYLLAGLLILVLNFKRYYVSQNLH